MTTDIEKRRRAAAELDARVAALDAEILRTLCHAITDPDLLNALQACQDGDPRNNPFQWRNAHALFAQRSSHENLSILVDFLAKKANKEPGTERDVKRNRLIEAIESFVGEKITYERSYSNGAEFIGSAALTKSRDELDAALQDVLT